MVNKNLGMLFLVKGVCGLKEIVGLIPDLVRMVEMPGNGKKKKEIVMQALREFLKSIGKYSPLLDIILSVLIDGVVALLFPKHAKDENSLQGA